MSEPTIDQFPEEQRKALETVLQQARERYGHHAGFDAVVTFIGHQDLISGLPWFIPCGLTGSELGSVVGFQ